MTSFQITLISALLVSPILRAQSSVNFTWGTSTGFQRLVTSDGSALSVNEFTIELGGFAGGFTPTLDNIDSWVANWQVFDAITSSDSDPSDGFIAGAGTDARFVGSASLNIDQTSDSEDSNNTDIFAPGSQAYVFIRNSDVIGVGTELLLYTSQEGNDWAFPSVQNSQTSFSPSFFVSQADDVVFGGVNGEAGPGGFTDTSKDFVLRTQTFVPEPSVSLLFVMTAIGFLGYRGDISRSR